jgi:hypothetical protein
LSPLNEYQFTENAPVLTVVVPVTWNSLAKLKSAYQEAIEIKASEILLRAYEEAKDCARRALYPNKTKALKNALKRAGLAVIAQPSKGVS